MNDIRNNLPLLYDFYIVVKEKSFSKAAEKNYVSQSNLSRNVQKLENILGLKLIYSNNKGIELTLDGEKLYKQTDAMFSTIGNDPFYENQDEITGNITIGTTRNIADNKLIEYLICYNKRYPKVKINILIDNAKNLNEYLMQHKIDVLIDYLPHINYSEKLDIEVKAIGEFQTCFACSKDFYEKEAFKIKELKDLNNFHLLIPGKSRRRQLLDEVLQRNNIALNPIMELPDSKLMIDLVLKSNSIGYFIRDEIEKEDLTELSLKESMPVNSIGIIYPKYTINKLTKEFVDVVLEECKNGKDKDFNG